MLTPSSTFTRTRAIAAVACAAGAAALGASATAGAAVPGAGEKTLTQTYPVATALCAKVSAGAEGRHLKRFATQVLADCSALQTNFTEAQSTVLAARAAIASQQATYRSAIVLACPNTGKPALAACRHTRRVDARALEILSREHHRVVRRYYLTIESGRLHFWHAIRALPGEHHVRTDAPIPVPPPVT